MSLTLSLNNALSGLRINQQSISVLSQNIANVNTDGYSRELVDQAAVYIDGVGSGVRSNDVIRKVDKYLQRAVQTQGSVLDKSDVVRQYFSRVQTLLGSPGQSNSIDSFMTTFFNSLQQLAGTPERTSFRANAITAGQTLADTISGTAHSLEDLRFQADQDMRDAVAKVNEDLSQLRDTNLALTRGSSVGQSTAGLLDQRDKLLRDISSYMDISTVFDAAGGVNVIAGNGVTLLDDAVHPLRYSPAASVDSFINGSRLDDLSVVTLDSAGNAMPNPGKLIIGNADGTTTSALSGGKIEGLRLMRDEVLPGMLDQLDSLASNMRDAMNAIHNDGSGFPPPHALTGTRQITSNESYNWTGSAMIAVLQSDGTPVPARYADETGVRPLNLNFDEIYPGTNGKISMQSIVNEINNHFGPPSPKAEVGVLNNIQLASDQDAVTGGAFAFDFDLDNISGDTADFFVNNITVRDAGGVDITNVTQGPPTLALDPAVTYITTNLDPTVQINLQDIGDLQVGDKIYLGPPGTPTVNGIAAANLTGYFTIENISGNQITITAGGPASSGGPVADASGVTLYPPYERVAAGFQTRTWDKSQLSVDLGLNAASAYYDITVDVGVVDDDGNLTTSQITYRVNNNQNKLLNDRYSATTVTGGGTRVLPTNVQDTMRAVMVDANGNTIPLVNGEYAQQPAYLKLVGSNSDYTVAISELDSKQIGDTANGVAGTNRGFSHFFELNNFFQSNQPSSTGDTVRNSAINLSVEQRLLDNANYVSTGQLVLSPQSSDPNAAPQYTYMRYAGDNQLATRLSGLANTTLAFGASGGLPSTNLTLGGYSSEMLGFMSAQASAADDEYTNAETLYNGFKDRSDAISGVNLDEELANTVIYQNAYSATARIITVVNQLFDDLLQVF